MTCFDDSIAMAAALCTARQERKQAGKSEFGHGAKRVRKTVSCHRFRVVNNAAMPTSIVDGMLRNEQKIDTERSPLEGVGES